MLDLPCICKWYIVYHGLVSVVVFLMCTRDDFTGIEGAFDGSGAKTVIPRTVIGKFSIRLVPDMDPVKVEQLVKAHVEKVHKARDSPNPIKYVFQSVVQISQF